MPPPDEPVSALNLEDEAVLKKMRDWVRNMLRPENRAEFDDEPEFKLVVINKILQENDLTDEDQWALQALGVVFGDALAARTGTHWAIALIDGNRVPILYWPPTDMRIYAYFAFEKCVAEGDEINVVELFLEFRDDIDRRKTLDALN